MLKNYLLTAWRSLWTRRIFSMINIAGLALGLASCCLIFLYVRFELSYDHFNRNADRIYRVVGDLSSESGVLHWHNTPGPMAAALKAAFPEVEETVRLIPGSILVRKGDVKFQEEHAMWADPSVFSIFDFPLKYGNPATALTEPNSVVLSESAARKYFGHGNPVGQSLLLSGKELHQFGKIFFYFSILALFISAFGLLGLASYSTLQRTREIGIRKVLGASSFGVVGLLSADFMKLVAFSCVIAWPVSWYAMHQWLGGFAYRISLGAGIFLVAGAGALIVALTTISFQAFRAAFANPVESLRVM